MCVNIWVSTTKIFDDKQLTEYFVMANCRVPKDFTFSILVPQHAYLKTCRVVTCYRIHLLCAFTGCHFDTLQIRSDGMSHTRAGAPAGTHDEV